MHYDKEKYLANAKAIKEMLETYTFNIDMNRWCSLYNEQVVDKTEHTCETSYCLVGYQAHLASYPNNFRFLGMYGKESFDYEAFSTHLSGATPFTPAWNFIYSLHWENSKESALKRMNYVIENNGKFPMDADAWLEFGWMEGYYQDLVTVLARLKG